MSTLGAEAALVDRPEAHPVAQLQKAWRLAPGIEQRPGAMPEQVPTARRAVRVDRRLPLGDCQAAGRHQYPRSGPTRQRQGRRQVAKVSETGGETDGADPVLLVLPSDHVIADEAAFRQAVLAAMPAAQSGQLVTFGIVPNAPETGYGYIKAAPGEGVRAVLM